MGTNTTCNQLYYPHSLADIVDNDIVLQDVADIVIRFNSAHINNTTNESNWYFGTDGQTPLWKHDFVTVALHEIAHGLGIISSVTSDINGNIIYGAETSSGVTIPAVFDYFVEDMYFVPLLDYEYNNPDLTSFATSNELFWNGDNLYWYYNDLQYPRLFAPSTFEPGSSIAHLNENTYNNTSQALMTPYTNWGEAVHTIGMTTINMLRDIGWDLAYEDRSFDMYIKDRPEDVGNEDYPYDWQADRDDSPDIWVRNQDDGILNQTHQAPNFNQSPVYVYVRVHSKDYPLATENLQNLNDAGYVYLYWSKSSSLSSWPDNWNGTNPDIGNFIVSTDNAIPYLEPGQSAILQFEWDILDPNIYDNWSTCLLARIDDSYLDPIVFHDPDRLDDDVYYNNNIAMKNVTVVDFELNSDPILLGNNIYAPPGKYMYIGNPTNVEQTYDIEFSSYPELNNLILTEQSEVNVIFDDQGWDIIKNNIDPKKLLQVRDNQIIIGKDAYRIENVTVPPNTRIPIYVGFNFLTEKVTDDFEFKYHVRQYNSSDDDLLGGVHYVINRTDRDLFVSNAGEDKVVDKLETLILEAENIEEEALYNWYDEEGNLVSSGQYFEVTPDVSKKYKLEIVALSDGLKDYDDITVSVNPNLIESIYPNPSDYQTTISYNIKGSNSSYITIFSPTFNNVNSYVLSDNSESISVYLQNYSTGIHTILLICDGEVVDSKLLFVE